MTFDAWWEVIKVLVWPAGGVVLTFFGCWIFTVDNRRRQVTADLYRQLEAERHARATAAADLVEEFTAWRLSAAERYATTADLARAVERVEAAINRLGERFDKVMHDVLAPARRGGQQ